MKHFWLARRSDGHRFEGTRISAANVQDAERQYLAMKYHFANLVIVGAKR